MPDFLATNPDILQEYRPELFSFMQFYRSFHIVSYRETRNKYLFTLNRYFEYTFVFLNTGCDHFRITSPINSVSYPAGGQSSCAGQQKSDKNKRNFLYNDFPSSYARSPIPPPVTRPQSSAFSKQSTQPSRPLYAFSNAESLSSAAVAII